MTFTATPTTRRPSLPRVLLRLWGFVLFVAPFFRELVLANLDLTLLLLSGKYRQIEPGFIEYPVDHLSRREILLLSHCLTLTPGSATVEISPDYSRLVIHVLDVRRKDQVIRTIREGLERPLLRWTR